ncbi:Glycosyltransferase involved in cell wall bisynthesis [Micromonospora viridifaciens]|uniref:Glycosyltransferase involved in cell wall bisynthesis n=1 Tax=Micromonospora viridifaciens TaxID=1881 RepID=A0A1C4ZKJ8_MICVI|nr:glycosyltransferase family 4 protein [Micromonospora viridifaciens]SCF33533.1 Glycosyltransferase involved in cell wall bisynthesis [Micromonospora viridifaciens]
MSAADQAGGAEPMHVLHVSHTGHRGGAELALARLLATERSWTATLCCPPGGDAFDGLATQGVTVDQRLPRLPVGGTRSRSPMLAARYIAALRAAASTLRCSPWFGRADLIHANTAAAGIICALANRGRQVPLVVHLRDLVTPESMGRFGYTAFTRLALPHVDGVIANSQATLASAADRLPAGVRRVVLQSPSGLRHRVTEPQVRSQVRAIGMVGRLQRWKGQHVFLRAFADVFRGTDCRAYLAGAPLFEETAYEQELRLLAVDLGIADQVSFLGHVDDVPSFIDSVDVLVHASVRPEPLGQTVLQALAHAKPLIATEGGGPSEWIRSGVNGLLVPPDRPEELAAALRKLAGSRELRVELATGAAATPGILSDAACAMAHAAFFEAFAPAAGSIQREGR